MNAKDVMIGSCVIVDGKIRYVSAITKKKIGYHTKSKEARMHYARMREIKPFPLNYEVVSVFNKLSKGLAYISWDDKCDECDHQYIINYHGIELSVRYVHEVQLIAKVLNLHCWYFEPTYDTNHGE